MPEKRRLLITGATGFIGRNCLLHFHSDDFECTALRARHPRMSQRVRIRSVGFNFILSISMIHRRQETYCIKSPQPICFTLPTKRGQIISGRRLKNISGFTRRSTLWNSSLNMAGNVVLPWDHAPNMPAGTALAFPIRLPRFRRPPTGTQNSRSAKP